MEMKIRDAETQRMARELARLQGVSVTEAVTNAIRKALDRERRSQGHALSQELLEIGARCARHIKRPLKSRDHARLLYDRKGLPR
jgi:antitoxin VapB